MCSFRFSLLVYYAIVMPFCCCFILLSCCSHIFEKGQECRVVQREWDNSAALFRRERANFSFFICASRALTRGECGRKSKLQIQSSTAIQLGYTHPHSRRATTQPSRQANTKPIRVNTKKVYASSRCALLPLPPPYTHTVFYIITPCCCWSRE